MANLEFKRNFEVGFTYIRGFMRNVARYGNRPALSFPQMDKSWTYRTLNSDVNKLAHALQNDGVTFGQSVMYLLRNCPEFVFCYLAPQKLGAVNIPANFRQAAGELALNIDDSCPAVFVYDSLYCDTVSKALTIASHRPLKVICVNTTNLEKAPDGEMFYEDYVNGCPTDEPVPEREVDIWDECTRLYTSGTTSRPKGVPLYCINEVLSAHDVIMHYPLSPVDRTMNTTPWFHRGGLHSGGPCPTLYVGGEVVILRDFNPTKCLEYIEKYRITFVTGVPTVLNMLVRARKPESDLSSLKGIVTMGSPLDRASCIKFQKELTPNIFNGYGTTETFWNAFLRPYDLPEHAGSCGHSCTDDDVRVVKLYPDRHAEPDDLAAQDGSEVGEIIIHSPAKAGMEYFCNEELSAAKFHNGFLYTGDLGTWDSEAFITVVGRKDDMIVSCGENIYPTQIESVLEADPRIREACVVGVADPLRSQIVVAYIVPNDPALTIGDVVEYIKSSNMLPIYKQPRLYRICDSLPHTPTGKLLRRDLQTIAAEDLAEGRLSRP
ncbi:MAG: acyl--CoA ligase [Bacteroidales bacterium]|nr:acyl--CoA ligase [Bacteroidales bacterium]